MDSAKYYFDEELDKKEIKETLTKKDCLSILNDLLLNYKDSEEYQEKIKQVKSYIRDNGQITNL